MLIDRKASPYIDQIGQEEAEKRESMAAILRLVLPMISERGLYTVIVEYASRTGDEMLFDRELEKMNVRQLFYSFPEELQEEFKKDRQFCNFALVPWQVLGTRACEIVSDVLRGIQMGKHEQEVLEVLRKGEDLVPIMVQHGGARVDRFKKRIKAYAGVVGKYSSSLVDPSEEPLDRFKKQLVQGNPNNKFSDLEGAFQDRLKNDSQFLNNVLTLGQLSKLEDRLDEINIRVQFEGLTRELQHELRRDRQFLNLVMNDWGHSVGARIVIPMFLKGIMPNGPQLLLIKGLKKGEDLVNLLFKVKEVESDLLCYESMIRDVAGRPGKILLSSIQPSHGDGGPS